MAEHGTPTEVAYARNGNVHLAYQTLGEGDRNIVYRVGGFIPLSVMWTYPPLSSFLRRIASLGRLILYDRRGVGLSDPVAHGDAGTTEQLAGDLLAVLDACGAESAIVAANGFEAPAAAYAAAEHPDRIEKLIFTNPVVRTQWAPDFTIAPTLEEGQVAVDMALGQNNQRVTGSGSAELGEFLDRAGREGASPGSARAMYLSFADIDIREQLPKITQPTLVLWRQGENLLGAPQGEALADRVPGSIVVALPGDEFFSFHGDAEPTLAEIERFVAGVVGGVSPDRVLKVMLFSDIVGSTEKAAEIGDDAWRVVLNRHDEIIAEALGRFDGEHVNPTGDGVLATFPTPSAALGCASAIGVSLEEIGLSIRVGIHAGEVESRGDDIGGLGVNLAARIMGVAGPGDILVSDAIAPLVRGTDLSFESLGARTLSGIPFEVKIQKLVSLT